MIPSQKRIAKQNQIFVEEPKMNKFVQALSSVMRIDMLSLIRSSLKQNQLKSNLAQSPFVQMLSDNLRVNLESLKRKLLRGDFIGDSHFKSELDKTWNSIKQFTVETLQDWTPVEVNVALDVLEQLKKQLEEQHGNFRFVMHHSLSGSLGTGQHVKPSLNLKKKKRNDGQDSDQFNRSPNCSNSTPQQPSNRFESDGLVLQHKSSRRGSSDIGDSKKTEETFEGDPLSQRDEGAFHDTCETGQLDLTGQGPEGRLKADIQQRVAELFSQEQDCFQTTVNLLKRFGLADNELGSSDAQEQSPYGSLQMLAEGICPGTASAKAQRVLCNLTSEVDTLSESTQLELLAQLRNIALRVKGSRDRDRSYGCSPHTPEKIGYSGTPQQTNFKEYLACSDEMNDSNNTSFLTGKSSP